MWRKLLIISMVLVFGMILLSPCSWADEEFEEDEGFIPCEQVDLAGTWNSKVGAMDEYGNHLCWEPCSLTIDATGAVEASGTYQDCSQVSSDIIGGSLTISSGCVIEGTIETSNGTINVVTGAILDNKLVLGRTQQ